MNDLMSVKRISSFESVLAAYKKSGIDLHNALDGGAGSGATARAMLKHLSEDAHIYAFEPFPGNHRFFIDADHRIELIPKALAESNKIMPFYVSSTVAEGSAWGKIDMAGYSSVGYLAEIDCTNNSKCIKVDCIRADEVISKNIHIGFIKLDLQGGELNALKGMPRLLSTASLFWIEYLGKVSWTAFLRQVDN
jgi:FkbM family methyltransferase